MKGYFDTRLPGQSYFGAEPDALAVNADGSRLYAANMGSDAVAVIDTKKLTAKAAKSAMVEPDRFCADRVDAGFDGLYSVAIGRQALRGNGQGEGDRAERLSPADCCRRNRMDAGETAVTSRRCCTARWQRLRKSDIAGNLPAWTEQVLASNRMKAAQQQITFADGAHDRIKHVIYIIKENRTYDQILGDLEQNGKPVGNGEAKWAMYGEAVTPNEHKLALQFGVLDNFFDSGEVSGDGHVWSNAAIGTDYLEKTWQQNYRGSERPYDYEGVVAEGYPLLQKIPDVNTPASGYLWGDLAAHGKTYYHFGEFISSTFCGQSAVADATLGAMLAGPKCARKGIAPGEPLPADWGGGVKQVAVAQSRYWQTMSPRCRSSWAISRRKRRTSIC